MFPAPCPILAPKHAVIHLVCEFMSASSPCASTVRSAMLVEKSTHRMDFGQLSHKMTYKQPVQRNIPMLRFASNTPKAGCQAGAVRWQDDSSDLHSHIEQTDCQPESGEHQSLTWTEMVRTCAEYRKVKTPVDLIASCAGLPRKYFAVRCFDESRSLRSPRIERCMRLRYIVWSACRGISGNILNSGLCKRTPSDINR